MFARALDNDDLLPTIRKRVLITHGANDPFVALEVVTQHKSAIAHAQTDVMANTGHSPFWQDSSAFDQRLQTFIETCSAVTTAVPV